MQNNATPIKRSSISIARIISFVVGGIVLGGLLTILIFSNPLLNSYLKPYILKTFSEVYPEYSLNFTKMQFSMMQNRFEFDSVSINAANRTISSNIRLISISRIDWIHLLWGGDLSLKDFTNSVVEINDITMKSQKSGYDFRIDQLHLSVADSAMTAESIEVFPLGGDEEFFKRSNYQQTRLHFANRQITLSGLACLDIIEGKKYHAHTIQLDDIFLDVLVNNDKPQNKKSPNPSMPNEMLSSIKGILRIDNLCIKNGQVIYGERMAVGSKPAIITFDSLHVLAEGIANQGKDGAVIKINVEGKFQKTGTMSVKLSIPVASTELSFQYSGVLNKMELNELNTFLETAEQMSIKSGFLQMATFDVTVVSGKASGNVRAFYRNLNFAVINKQTRSENGFFDKIASFIANTFKIRTSNVPDNKGLLKIGKVKYSRKRDDPFFRFSWFSIRSGVKDVVGF